MQHNTAFSVVNVSRPVPGWNKQAEGSLFILEPGRCGSQWYRASFADNASEKRVFHLVEEIPKKKQTKKTHQNKTNSSTHRSCCAQRKMVHLLCQGAHHVCWLHWHWMVHGRCNHSTLEAHTMSIWKSVPQEGNLKLKHSRAALIANMFALLKRLNSACINFTSIHEIFCSSK